MSPSIIRRTDPADGHPILRWSRVDGAVMYDVQILKKEEEKGDDGKVSTSYEPFMDDQKAYTTGLELDLPDTFLGQVFYWRVRGLDLKAVRSVNFRISKKRMSIFSSLLRKSRRPCPFSTRDRDRPCSIRLRLDSRTGGSQV